MSPKRKNYQTPEWAAYWADGSAPHPDAGGAQRRGQRVLAPFSKARQTHYVHHYGMDNEHYHSSVTELEGCDR